MGCAPPTGTCYVWRMMRGASLTTHFEPLHKLRAHAGAVVLKCLLSPDVRQLATTASDKSVKLWNVDGFTLDRTLTGARGTPLYHWSPWVQGALQAATRAPDGPSAGQLAGFGLLWHYPDAWGSLQVLMSPLRRCASAGVPYKTGHCQHVLLLHV